jgi:hypothetical protein
MKDGIWPEEKLLVNLDTMTILKMTLLITSLNVTLHVCFLFTVICKVFISKINYR